MYRKTQKNSKNKGSLGEKRKTTFIILNSVKLLAELVDIVVDRLVDDAEGFVAWEDLINRGILVLEVLVDREEVAHFLENVARKLINAVVHIVVGIVKGTGDDLLVASAVIDHCDNSDRIRAHKRHRLDRLGTQEKHVERVAIVAKGSGNEAVVGGIVSRGVEDSVEHQKSGLLVELIFFLASLGDLDNADEVLGCDSFR